ncbi:branched-chain amino acid ABC transporter permease [Mesorhizobium sp. YM1C-6-2]|uniref:branched-chain amino acid ABC transporter permease n=1 Tax=Mesorhizobium sp. YM1C-6-2 TaxID=1827501 RepID=UPI000EF1F102|nr:branched-chain amino acid ABC transporter permease [Mesorhizobium sp. YM1C-6-2]RLP23496.1 branched-chain amino acid ABC transporter permease [Mesorhizobium sp. YM1C-6-2]
MNALQMLIDAASVGGLYALTALGLGLIFGVIGLVNFAYGEYIMVGAYVLLLTAGVHWPFAILAVLIFVILFALASDWLVFRQVRRAQPETLMIVSFGLSFMIQHLYVVLFGSLTRTVNFLPEINRSIEIGGLRVAGVSILQIAATIILTTALALVINYTKIGYQMRAVSENPRMARLVGVNSNRIVAAAFAISAVLAVTVTVLFVAQTGSMTPFFGVSLTMIGFVATVIGGLGSLPGCALGGFLVGALTTLLQMMLPSHLQPFREAFVFAAVIIVLLVRPQGLIAVRSAWERV